jgi:[ribosomal protein S18]-alanine N-acetyltransferase
MAARFEIRRVRRKDLDRVLEVERASFGAEAYDRNLFADYFDAGGALFLVAVRRGRIEGYMIACARGERAELISVAVEPAARGRGAASALMDSVMRRLRRRRISRFVLMVKERNPEAQAFYAKYAFHKVRRVRRYYEDGSDGWLMAREI